MANKKKKSKPVLTIEGRENQLIQAATDLAERQMRDGTASAQVITHYLKLGSTREKLEQEKIARENHFLAVKAEREEAHKKIEEMYTEALNAMREYSGNTNDDIMD